MLKDNSKLALTYTFVDFIKALKAKADPIFHKKELTSSKSARTIARIFSVRQDLN